MKEITIYLHGSKETMWNEGKKARLKGNALEYFKYACHEVKVVLKVDETTGEAEIFKVNDKLLEVM